MTKKHSERNELTQLEFSIFTDKYESVQDIIDRGHNAALLRNNPAFKRAISDLYQKLTLEEDTVIRSLDRSNRDKNSDQRHYAMMRSLLVDLVQHLDHYVAEGEQMQIMEDPYNG